MVSKRTKDSRNPARAHAHALITEALGVQLALASEEFRLRPSIDVGPQSLAKRYDVGPEFSSL
jgi:hypothetical protein